MAHAVIAIVSDIHAVSTTALCPPGAIRLDDGGEYHPSKAQLWLWQCWTDYWDRVERVRDEEKADLFIILLGDLIDGDHHGTAQIITKHPGVMHDIAMRCIEEPLGLGPDHIFVIRGTESHTGKSASKEEALAKNIRDMGHPLEEDPAAETASWWYMMADINGKRIDAAHHGRMGTRSYTRGSYSRLYAFDIWAERQLNGERPPDIAFRAHRHKMADSGDHYPTRLLQSGAWQLQTAFAHKIATESLADIGGWITTIREDGSVFVRKAYYQPKRGAVWTG
ncbi:MAG: hypothetical protein GWN53_17375 [Gammaproteobacteria bacterium]|uniref:Calcineurin-like phosphoesterase domain-containing protein n=1 Tax=Candidatus Kutchimonas denitrificans TaxID=3056748 RepID=A0AAE5CD84_9BACT|nr:hypothetical protein [Candidatus Kutchimonas denitrificans]NIV53613.1 hypothetical protein [Gammaproteobacteria bacterium]